MRALVFLLATLPLSAAVDGTVINATSGQPQAGVPVSLIGVGSAGMQPLATVKSDASGRFRVEQSPQTSALLQAAFQGVTYSTMLQPGEPASGLTLKVFEAGPQPGAAKVTEDVVILEPSGSQLSVRHNFIWQNGGNRTFRDSAAGTLRFWAPPEAKDTLRVSATPPGGMPLDQSAAPAGLPNVYKLDFPIKPGDTTIEVTYTVPFTTPGSFSGRTLETDAALRLAVPSGVTLKGEGLTLLGQDPQSQASVYGVQSRDFTVQIEGSGVMGSPSEASDSGSDSSFDQILPRVYDNLYPILGLSLVILALGFALLYRMKATPYTTARPPAAPKSRPRS